MIVPTFEHNGALYDQWSMEDALAAGIPQATLDAALAAAAQARLACTPRQARLALAGAGLLGAVEAWIATADDPTRISWEYATQIRRDFPALTGAAAALGLTEAQIDALFETASGL